MSRWEFYDEFYARPFFGIFRRVSTFLARCLGLRYGRKKVLWSLSLLYHRIGVEDLLQFCEAVRPEPSVPTALPWHGRGALGAASPSAWASGVSVFSKHEAYGPRVNLRRLIRRGRVWRERREREPCPCGRHLDSRVRRRRMWAFGKSKRHALPPRSGQVRNCREGLCQQTRVAISHLEKLRAPPSVKHGKGGEMSRDGRRGRVPCRSGI